MSPAIDPRTASALIDLDAFVANIETLRAHVAPAAVMVVVKADAYGHGMIECARVAREAGADWLGVATPEEALALREAGDRGRLLAWLYGPDADLAPLVAADVDVSAQSEEQIARDRPGGRDRGAPGAGPSQDRHRAVPQRRHRGGLAGGLPRRPARRAGRGPGGRRRLVAPGRRRRAGRLLGP